MPPYTVHQGDTLWDIAAQCLGNPGCWPDLAHLNGITPYSPLLIGQELQLPLVGAQTPAAFQAQSPNGGYERQPATRFPAKLYLFVLADEILPSGKVVRRVMVLNEWNAELMRSAPELAERLMWPEKFGMRPPNPLSPISLGRHAKGMNDSRFLSASRLPEGSPRFDGKPYWIDVARAKKAGVTIHDTNEILRDIDRIIAKTRDPQVVSAFFGTKKRVIADAEVLLEGEVPASAIKSGVSMGLTRGLRLVQGVGIILSVYDLEQAGVQSYRHQSVRPLTQEAVRQLGGWGGAFVGLKLGAATGLALGIEGGPGAVITAAVGGIAGGIVGFIGSDWIAKKFF